MAYETGTASSANDLIDKISAFLTGSCGWSLLDTVATYDKVFFSNGTTPGRYRPLYVRWRNISNYIHVSGYTLWVDSGTYNDELYNSSTSRAPANSPPVTYWFFGNADRLIVVIKNVVSYYAMYGGYISTYHQPDKDDLPLCVVGHSSSSTDLTGDRARMYVPFTLSSGTAQYYHSHYQHVF